MRVKNKLLLIMLIVTLSFIAVSCINVVSATTEINENYTLNADSTEAIVVKSGSNVTIDLNGYNLTVDGDAITVESGATATIRGSGSKVNSTQGAVVNLGGTVTIESGTYNSSEWYTVKNLANMTIKGGVFTQDTNNTGNSSLIANGWYNGKTSSENDRNVPVPTGNSPVAILTIDGGTFTQYTTTSTIKSDDWSKTIINSGEFTSVNGTLIQVTGDVAISGGKYKGDGDIFLFNGDGTEGYEATKLNVSGGDFDAKYITRTHTTGTLTITGGTFKNLTEVQNPMDKKDYSKNITGGTYNCDVKDEIASGYSTYKTTSGYDVKKTGEISVESNEIIMSKGSTKDLGISVTNNLEKYLTISSNDDSVVSIKDNKITANKVGKATITASLSNGTSKQVSVVVYEIVGEENTDEVNDTKQVVNEIVNQIINGEEVAGLTDEQKQAIETSVKDGEKLVVDVDSTLVDSEEISEDASKVEAVIKNDAKIAGYYNIDIIIKNEQGTEITKLSQLNKEIQITISIPEGISKVEDGYTRKYTIIRVHDGVAEELETIYNENGTLTFSSDKYSTYAITYVDTLNNSIEGNEDNVENPVTGDNVENPVTGDNIIVYIALLSIAILGMVISIKIRNKNKN